MTDYYTAGFGFRAAASFDSLVDAYQRALQGRQINSLAAPKDKCAHPALLAFADSVQLPLSEIDPDDLEARVTPTKSDTVMAARGTGSVAEACALIAAGRDSDLYGKREISEDRLAVCAIAKRR